MLPISKRDKWGTTAIKICNPNGEWNKYAGQQSGSEYLESDDNIYHKLAMI